MVDGTSHKDPNVAFSCNTGLLAPTAVRDEAISFCVPGALPRSCVAKPAATSGMVTRSCLGNHLILQSVVTVPIVCLSQISPHESSSPRWSAPPGSPFFVISCLRMPCHLLSQPVDSEGQVERQSGREENAGVLSP